MATPTKQQKRAKRAAAKARDSIATYTVWLDQAKATLADFTR